MMLLLPAPLLTPPMQRLLPRQKEAKMARVSASATMMTVATVRMTASVTATTTIVSVAGVIVVAMTDEHVTGAAPLRDVMMTAHRLLRDVFAVRLAAGTNVVTVLFVPTTVQRMSFVTIRASRTAIASRKALWSSTNATMTNVRANTAPSR